MLQLYSMPSHNGDPIKCESYTTTPRSVRMEIHHNINIQGHVEEDEETETDMNTSATRKWVRSAPSHFSDSICKSLIQQLLDNSEQCSIDDSLIFESSVVDDWLEAASGWREIVPYAKYVTNKTVTRNKSEASLKKEASTRKSVRCVDEDLTGEAACSSSWKGNYVEPVTYRYIPNNGYYRNFKNEKGNGMREWVVLRKSKSERSLVTSEIRQAQRTLKRDLDSQLKTNTDDQETSQISQNTSPVRTLYRQQDALSQSATPQHAAARVLYRSQAAKASDFSGPGVENCEETSGALGLASVAEKGMDMTHLARCLPPKDQELVKSVSDLFMENFNTRLHALEKEIRIPYSPVKKVTDSAHTSSHSPSQLSKKMKEGRGTDSAKPTIQSTKEHGKDFGEDLFTVIPVKRELPLRPLEKLTPKHKQMEKETSNLGKSLSPDSHHEDGEAEDDDLVIMLAAATSQPQTHPNNTDPSDIGTVRSALAMTNFNIEKMRNVPLCSDYNMSVPKPFYVQKGGASIQTQHRGAMHYSVRNTNRRTTEQAVADNGTAADFATIDKKTNKEMPVSVGTMLPEIMGKRLTVTTTTHRLL